MTLPRERSNSLKKTREFLRDLLDPKKTPKVPKAIRMEAYWCLRHFPADYEINYAADGAPDTFGHIEEDLDPYKDIETFRKDVKEATKKKKKK
ncbi:MAG TPA: BPSL0761 family protein [Rhabdochlamydiaceae bacterium]